MSKGKDSIYLKSSLVRNTLPGTEGTYRDAISSIDLCGFDTFAERVGRKCGYPAAVVKNVIGADGAEAQEILSTRLYRITGVCGLTLEAAISGSVPSLDSPLGEDNKVYVAARPSDRLKNAASGITPVRSGTGDVMTIDKVQDEASGKVGVIDGTKTFILTGWGLTTSGEGEGVSVKSMVNGTETAATVSRNEKGQAVWASLNSALPAGKAKVYVMTGGAEPGELWPVSRTVTILAGDPPPADPPVVTSYLVDEMEGEPIDMNTSSLSIFGSNLATAQKVQFFYQDGASPAATPFYEKTVTPSSDTSLATGALGCTAATTDSSGYFRVVGPGGASAYVECSFAM